jgi:hypothetical protein
VAASVPGADHRRDGRGCDDAFRYRAWGSLAVFAVADGAGSARLGAVGANVAVESASAMAWTGLVGRSEDPALTLTNSVCLAQRSIEQVAQLCGPTVEIGDLATTLLLVAVGEFGLRSVQVGDGAIVVETEAGLELLTPERDSEYLNITEFLSSPHLPDRIHHRSSISKPQAVCLMTDGIERLAIRDVDRTPVAGFFGPLLERVDDDRLTAPQLRRFLGSASVTQRTGDDATLVLARRR